MRRGTDSTLLLLILGAGLASCGPPPAEVTGESSAEVGIVTLAPHLAEMLYVIGAGDLLVGVSAYTDYPDAATSLPVVGDAFAIDQEQLVVLNPSIIIAWKSGTPAHVVDELRDRGFRVEVITTRGLKDVATAMRHIGSLTGREKAAEKSAHAFLEAIAALRNRYRDAEDIDVYYQIALRPLYTINNEHFVSEIISVCGGNNVFSDLNDLAPLVSVEAVLQRDPEAMLAGDDGGDDAFDDWKRWPDLAANRYGNHYFLTSQLIGRPSPRLTDAARELCTALDMARQNRLTVSDSEDRSGG